jgi:hypothetical protein
VPTEIELLTAAESRAAALVDQDPEALAAMLHPDFLYVTASGQRLDRAGYVTFCLDSGIRWQSQHLTGVATRIVGTTGVLAGDVVDDVILEGVPQQWRLTTTQTYVWDQAWLYLAGHTAPLP